MKAGLGYWSKVVAAFGVAMLIDTYFLSRFIVDIPVLTSTLIGLGCILIVAGVLMTLVGLFR